LWCRVSLGESCPYRERCPQAHSEDELYEWKEYFEQRKAKLQSEIGKWDKCQFAEQLMEKWLNAEHPETIVSYSALHVAFSFAETFFTCWWK